MEPTKVPVGAATIAGWSTTAIAPFAAALIVQIFRVPDAQAVELAAAVLSVGSFLVTQAGRYAQAVVLARHAAPTPAATPARNDYLTAEQITHLYAQAGLPAPGTPGVPREPALEVPAGSIPSGHPEE